LEDILDAHLLERNHKLFLFTPLGEEIVRRSRLLIEQSEELCDYANNQEKPMQGTLRLGIIPTIAPFILKEIHASCRRQYPDLSLLIKEDTTDMVLKFLEEGTLDMIVFALPYPVQHVYTRVLCRDYFQLVLPKQWQHKGIDNNLNQLPKESLFLLEKDHCLTGHALQGCELNDSKKINPFYATSLYSLIQMITHHPGVTYLPTLAVNQGILSGTDLVATAIDAYRDIGVAWRHSSFKKNNNQLLADLIQKILVEIGS